MRTTLNLTGKTLAVLALASTLAACGGTQEGATDESFEETDEALSTGSYSFVSLRRDIRKCMSPMCGGYFARDLNKSGVETYVSALDLRTSGLDQASIDAVRAAPDGELVVRGKLGAKDRGFNTRPLIVSEAYRGLPGVSPSRGDVYYKAALRNPQITCITAPCNNIRAQKLGTSSKPYITGLDVELALMPFVQESYVAYEVLQQDAIVAGLILDGQRFPGGKEKILVATQVFIKMPAMPESCPVFRLRACPEGQTWSYTRTEKRCVSPAGCVETMYCRMMVPSCEEGYVLQSWTGGNGCPAYACDPAFSQPSQEE